MNDTQRLTEWVINKIKTKYPDDIALLVAVEGASVNGDGHGEPFDYFVPATERGNELGQTFIIGGVGNDLYPRSWERCERTANLDDRMTICLGDVKILYSRSEADVERFEEIRRKLFENLKNPELVYRKALERLDIAMGMYRTMMFEEKLNKVRGLAGFISYYLAMGVAYLNGTYVGEGGDWHKGMLTMYTKWAQLPERFIEYYELILTAKSVGELRSIAHLLIASARRFIAERKPAGDTVKSTNFHELADWYQELRTAWNRIYYYCETGNADAVFFDACNLQNELSIISDEFDLLNSSNIGERFGLAEMDLLGAFDANDLAPLAKRATELEHAIIAAIEANGVKIRRYATLDDFLADAK